MKKKILVPIALLVIVSLVVTIRVLKENSSNTHTLSLERPQEPTTPYTYYSEEVSFQNAKANITLQGTLTLPSKEGNYPAVTLISGSGPQIGKSNLSGLGLKWREGSASAT